MISSVSSSDSTSLLSSLQTKMFQKADTNGDGKIDSDEMNAIQANAPQGGTAAKDIFTELDSDGDGSISREESDAAIAKMFCEMSQEGSGTCVSGLAAGSVSESERATELFGRIDTDGDGAVTQEEFVANRPDEMSEEQATAMWSQLDTDSTGSLTESQLVTAMASQAPPQGPTPGPPPGDSTSSISSTAATEETDSTKETAESEPLQALRAAIQQYTSTMGQDGSSSLLTSAGASTLSVQA